jgi:hypothetical protein
MSGGRSGRKSRSYELPDRPEHLQDLPKPLCGRAAAVIDQAAVIRVPSGYNSLVYIKRAYDDAGSCPVSVARPPQPSDRVRGYTCPRGGPAVAGGDRRRACRAVRFRTRHVLALAVLNERGPLLPHPWVSGDDEVARCTWFRQELRGRGAGPLAGDAVEHGGAGPDRPRPPGEPSRPSAERPVRPRGPLVPRGAGPGLAGAGGPRGREGR